jgi:RimJ/RimL family protein N-acetyltransferase
MIDVDVLPTLAADRVVLRPLTESDVDAIFEIFSDPDVMRYWSSTALVTMEQARVMLRQIHDGFRDRTLWKWGIALRDDDRVVGTCTLTHFDWENRRAELGYALGSAYWGRRLMSEALDTLVAFAFDGLGLHRLEADVDPRNTASIKSLERLGFQREGYLRERWLVGGGIQDSLFYGLLRSDWLGR